MQVILELCFLIVNKFPFSWTATHHLRGQCCEGHKHSPTRAARGFGWGEAVPGSLLLGGVTHHRHLGESHFLSAGGRSSLIIAPIEAKMKSLGIAATGLRRPSACRSSD